MDMSLNDAGVSGGAMIPQTPAAGNKVPSLDMSKLADGAGG